MRSTDAEIIENDPAEALEKLLALLDKIELGQEVGAGETKWLALNLYSQLEYRIERWNHGV